MMDVRDERSVSFRGGEFMYWVLGLTMIPGNDRTIIDERRDISGKAESLTNACHKAPLAKIRLWKAIISST
jgi:hypothetical protein